MPLRRENHLIPRLPLQTRLKSLLLLYNSLCTVIEKRSRVEGFAELIAFAGVEFGGPVGVGCMDIGAVEGIEGEFLDEGFDCLAGGRGV